MYLKLDKLINKKVNNIKMRIYRALIAYLILELIESPAFYGRKSLDKLSYLQLELSRRCSVFH